MQFALLLSYIVLPLVTCADNYRDVLGSTDNTMYDVAFLDIQMPGMMGISLAKELKDRCPNVNIVFATAYSEYAVEAFYICQWVFAEANTKKARGGCI